jgi:CDP-diglyceride synthetase
MNISAWHPFVITIALALFFAGLPFVLMGKVQTKKLLLGTLLVLLIYLLLVSFNYLILNAPFINVLMLNIELNRWSRGLLTLAMFLLPMSALLIFALARSLFLKVHPNPSFKRDA